MTKKKPKTLIDPDVLPDHLRKEHGDWGFQVDDMHIELVDKYHLADHLRAGADAHHQHEEHQVKKRELKEAEGEQLAMEMGT